MDEAETASDQAEPSYYRKRLLFVYQQPCFVLSAFRDLVRPFAFFFSNQKHNPRWSGPFTHNEHSVNSDSQGWHTNRATVNIINPFGR